jgi:uncharacterized SAM-binding protein YcdF (DUF218 family)
MATKIKPEQRMIRRRRGWVMRHRRVFVVVAALAVAYCVAVEVLLPREDQASGQLDAVMVLTSGLRDGIDPSGEDRLRRAVEVATTSGVPIYVSRVTLGGRASVGNDSGQQVIVGSHIRWTILEGVVGTTHEEAERLARTIPNASVAVITSRLHTRRACATFARAGLAVTCISSGPDRPLWKAPYFVLYESAALLKYLSRGWI